MPIVPSGQQIALQGSNLANVTLDGSTDLLNTTMTVGSVGVDFYYQLKKQLSGSSTIYYEGFDAKGGTAYGFASTFAKEAGRLYDSGASAHSATTSYPAGFGTGGGNSNTIFATTTGGGGVFGYGKPHPLTSVLTLYGSYYWQYMGMGSNLSSTSAIGSGSNLKWQSASGNYWVVEQLLWFKNTDTSGKFIDEDNQSFASSHNPVAGTDPDYNGSHITSDDNTNSVMICICEKTDSNYNTNPNNIAYGSAGIVPRFNSDVIFGSIVINGVLELELGQATASSVLPDIGTSNYNRYSFEWKGLTDAQINSLGTSGTVSIKIKSPKFTGNYNNGIAEEFPYPSTDSVQSSNVEISEYYRTSNNINSAAYVQFDQDNTGGSKGSTSLPASGQIKLSDFYKVRRNFEGKLTTGIQTGTCFTKGCVAPTYYGFKPTSSFFGEFPAGTVQAYSINSSGSYSTDTVLTQHGHNLAQYETTSPGNNVFSGWDQVDTISTGASGGRFVSGTVYGNAYQDRGSGTWSGTVIIRARDADTDFIYQELTASVSNSYQSFLRSPGSLRSMGSFDFFFKAGSNVVFEAGCTTNHGHSSCIKVFSGTLTHNRLKVPTLFNEDITGFYWYSNALYLTVRGRHKQNAFHRLSIWTNSTQRPGDGSSSSASLTVSTNYALAYNVTDTGEDSTSTTSWTWTNITTNPFGTTKGQVNMFEMQAFHKLENDDVP